MEKKNKYKYQSLYLITKQSDSKYLLTLDYTSLCTTYKEIFISQKEENLLPGGSLYSKARNAWNNLETTREVLATDRFCLNICTIRRWSQTGGLGKILAYINLIAEV